MQSKLQTVVVLILCTASAVGAGVAGASPTGLRWWDPVLSGVFGLVIAVAGTRLQPWPVLLALGLTAPFSASQALQLAAAAVFLVVLAVQVADGGPALRLATTAGSAIAASVVLRLSTDLPPLDQFGAATIVGGTTTVFLLGAAYSTLPRGSRRIVHRSGAGLVFVVGLMLLPLAVVGLSVKAEAATGAAAANEGLTAARQGDVDTAAQKLAVAERSLGITSDRLGSYWLAPTRLIPVLGQHIDAATVMATEGRELARAAGAATDVADPTQLRGPNGKVDLEFARTAAVPLEALSARLNTSQKRLSAVASPWLLPQLESRRFQAADQVERAIPEAAIAANAMGVLPTLMGADSPQRYLVLLATPAESRELGGFLGNYIELVVEDGALSITDSGRTNDLYRRGPSVLPDSDAYPIRYLANNPEKYPQNWTGLPDFPMAAEAVRGMYSSIGGDRLDGVLYLDPIGLASLLQFTGPIEVPEIDRTLDHTTLADYLLIEQYGRFDDKADRIDVLDVISLRAFTQLQTANITDPQLVGDAIGPVARGGHLLMTVFDPEANAFLESVQLTGTFPEPDDDDFLSVVQANAASNKLDTFLQRTVRYDVEIENSQLQASVEVDLHNTASRSSSTKTFGVPGSVEGWPHGTNLVHLSIYTPHELQQVTIDGEPVPAERQIELGYNRYLVIVPVPLGATIPVHFELLGIRPTLGDYKLTLANQALATTDDVTVSVRRGELEETQRLSLIEDSELTFFNSSL